MRVRSFIRNELPLFSTFYFTTLGFGGMQFARPLFAASFGVSLVLVGLVTAMGAIGRIVAGPISGALADRVGRKPLVLTGLGLRVVSGLLEFTATSYEQFLIYEFIGSVGLSIWNTGANTVLADVSTIGNRGRVMALRTASQRLGQLSGPFIAALLVAWSGDLRTAFLLNAVTKGIALVIFLFLVRESRPEPAAARVFATQAEADSVAKAESLRMFLTPPFMTVVFAALAYSMISGSGAFEILFPLHAQNVVGLEPSEIGQYITLAGFVGFFSAFLGGFLTDRFGRKASLVPGLLLQATGGLLFAAIVDVPGVVLAVMVLGSGEGMAMGTAQVMAMDMAPVRRRGVFLGVWQLVLAVGQAIAPLLLGAVATWWGIPAAFVAVSGFVILAALVMVLFGPETRHRPPVDVPAPGLQPAPGGPAPGPNAAPSP